jgi:hypothetical protein
VNPKIIFAGGLAMSGDTDVIMLRFRLTSNMSDVVLEAACGGGGGPDGDRNPPPRANVTYTGLTLTDRQTDTAVDPTRPARRRRGD